MDASGDGDGGRPTGGESSRGDRWVGAAAAAATTLVFVPPILVRSPSTTQAVPPGWLVALILAPFSTYLVARPTGSSLPWAAGFPPVPLMVLLSAAAICLDVWRHNMMPDSGEAAMSYGIAIPVPFAFGILLMIAVAAATRLGARHRGTKKRLRRPWAG